MNSLGKVLGLLALGLLAAALILGFKGVTSESGFDCGSAFIESDDLGSDEFSAALRGKESESGCDKARSDAQALPIVLGVLGLVAVGAAVVTGRAEPSARSAPGGP